MKNVDQLYFQIVIRRGFIEINSKTGEVKYNLDYYTLGHISKFVVPGARRVDCYTYSNVEAVAFENPDGTRVLIVSNRTKTNKKILVEEGGRKFEYVLPGYAAATFVWK
ncbi:MAG: glycoside hydrolase family 30 beta sandwich domain-containing protein [Fervidobacterium sp.]